MVSNAKRKGYAGPQRVETCQVFDFVRNVHSREFSTSNDTARGGRSHLVVFFCREN